LEAEAAYRRAIRIDSKYEEAYYNLAVLVGKDRPSEAKALLRRAIELDPDYGAAHRELGMGAAPQAQERQAPEECGSGRSP